MKRLKERYVGQSENGGDQIENHENFAAVYTIAKNDGCAKWREAGLKQPGFVFFFENKSGLFFLRVSAWGRGIVSGAGLGQQGFGAGVKAGQIDMLFGQPLADKV